jgi:hypothetical protein
MDHLWYSAESSAPAPVEPTGPTEYRGTGSLHQRKGVII